MILFVCCFVLFCFLFLFVFVLFRKTLTGIALCVVMKSNNRCVPEGFGYKCTSHLSTRVEMNARMDGVNNAVFIINSSS